MRTRLRIVPWILTVLLITTACTGTTPVLESNAPAAPINVLPPESRNLLEPQALCHRHSEHGAEPGRSRLQETQELFLAQVEDLVLRLGGFLES